MRLDATVRRTAAVAKPSRSASGQGATQNFDARRNVVAAAAGLRHSRGPSSALQIRPDWCMKRLIDSMKHPISTGREWDESPSAAEWPLKDNSSMFQLLFERSADAIWLFDPQAGVFVDCNPAAVELMGAGTKERLLGARPEDLSPPFQPDGTPTAETTAQIVVLV